MRKLGEIRGRDTRAAVTVIMNLGFLTSAVMFTQLPQSSSAEEELLRAPNTARQGTNLQWTMIGPGPGTGDVIG